jgi:hypothetical protein
MRRRLREELLQSLACKCGASDLVIPRNWKGNFCFWVFPAAVTSLISDRSGDRVVQKDQFRWRCRRRQKRARFGRDSWIWKTTWPRSKYSPQAHCSCSGSTSRITQHLENSQVLLIVAWEEKTFRKFCLSLYASFAASFLYPTLRGLVQIKLILLLNLIIRFLL